MPNANSWMTDNFAALSSKALRQIVFPGAHDAGMSELHGTRVNIETLGSITKTQSLDIYNQVVTAGARYLDVRPVHYIASVASDIPTGDYTAHYSKLSDMWFGLIGRSVEHLCDDLVNAMSQMGDKEVVLLELSHGAQLMEGYTWSVLSPAQQAGIVGYLVRRLGTFLYQSADSGSKFLDLKLADVVSAGNPGPKIFLWSSDDSYTACGFTTSHGFFTNANLSYYNSYYDAITHVPEVLVGDLKDSLIKYAAKTPPQDPFLLSWHCTGTVGSGSLKDLAGRSNQLFTDAIAEWFTTGVINTVNAFPSIVAWDFMSDDLTEMLRTCVELNYGLVTGFVDHVILEDRSRRSPSIASLDGRLYMAWSGDGNDLLNVMYSTDNGRSFGHRYTSSQRSGKNPSLCVHNGMLYIAWNGNGNNKLNIAQVVISDSGITGLANQVTLDARSPMSPALASLGGRLYLAWNGDGNNDLNVMYSSDNGRTFGNQYRSSERTTHSPALCAHGQNLFIAWSGDSNFYLNVAQVVISGSAITGFSNHVKLDESSSQNPSLASLNGELHIAWRGVSNTHLNLLRSADDGLTFTDKYTSSQESDQAPELGTHNGNLYVTWNGVGNKELNIVLFKFY